MHFPATCDAMHVPDDRPPRSLAATVIRIRRRRHSREHLAQVALQSNSHGDVDTRVIFRPVDYTAFVLEIHVSPSDQFTFVFFVAHDLRKPATGTSEHLDQVNGSGCSVSTHCCQDYLSFFGRRNANSLIVWIRSWET